MNGVLGNFKNKDVCEERRSIEPNLKFYDVVLFLISYKLSSNKCCHFHFIFSHTKCLKNSNYICSNQLGLNLNSLVFSDRLPLSRG